MIDWLLNGEPREAQLEALRRSYRGVATRDSLDGPVFHRPIPGHRGNEPAKGWGHLLEMRVGKTPTHLGEGALFRRDYDFRWQVVLAPNAFKPDWPLEAQKFGYPADSIALDSSNRRAVQSFIDKRKISGGLIAVNYEALGSSANTSLIEQVLGPRTLIGADESINAKNHKSSYTQEAHRMFKMCGARRIMTGKPTTQGASDLYMQLRLIGQLEGVMFADFKNTYDKVGGFQGKQIIGIKNEELLHAILERCTFNGRKVDWLRTPGRDYMPPRKIELLPEQRALYDRMEQDFLVELVDGTIVSADQIIGKLMKMQQIASGFIIDEEGKVHNLMPLSKNPKIQAVRQVLELEVDTKVIVVCHYQHTIDMMEEALAPFQPAIIRGDQWHVKNKRDKLAEKARFNLDRGSRVLIGQEQALRYGHTLMGNPADPCHTTIFAENNYSLNDRSQCEERNQGEGQSSPIGIMDFVATKQDMNTIAALQRKEDIAATVMRYARESGVLPRAQG